jgi:hypothetical protein
VPCVAVLPLPEESVQLATRAPFVSFSASALIHAAKVGYGPGGGGGKTTVTATCAEFSLSPVAFIAEIT